MEEHVERANVATVTTSSAVLGQVLARLRQSKGIKQNDLAARLGLGTSTWSRVENGDAFLSVEQLMAAAKALDMTPASIMNLVEKVEKHLESNSIKINRKISATGLVEKIEEISISNDSSSKVRTQCKGTASTLDMQEIGAAIGLAGFCAAAVVPLLVPVVGVALGSVVKGVLATLLKKD